MIFILTNADDVHADEVTKHLDASASPYRRFDLSEYPKNLGISMACDGDGTPRFVFELNGERVDSSAISSIWYRRPRRPIAHARIGSERQREYVEAECHAHIEEVLEALHVLQVPASPARQRVAEMKVNQLALAHRFGLTTPRTLITNSPDDFLDFHASRRGPVVSKLASSLFVRHFGGDFSRYTQLVRPMDVVHAGSIELCPIIFQEYVEKAYELRITVVGDEMFAAEIHSQKSNRARYDWRHYDLDNTPHHPHELPQGIRECLAAFVAHLGLRYAAIDMIVTPAGDYVFLEINPNGQYRWIEKMTGLPISAAIARLLTAGNHAVVID